LKRIFIPIVVVAILILGILFVYFKVNGTPCGKTQFANKVESYVLSKYPDVTIRHQEVVYSFKSMNYSSTIYTISGTYFHVSTDHENEMQDDYFASIWESRVSSVVTDMIQRQINKTAYARFVIETSNDKLAQYKNSKSYAEFSSKIQGNAKC
jgi:uncharacterized protein YxeA